jgi:hypothetical protein
VAGRQRISTYLIDVITTWLGGTDHRLDLFGLANVHDRVMSASADSEHGYAV